MVKRVDSFFISLCFLFVTACKGNGNRFAKYEDCLAHCKVEDTEAPMVETSLAGNVISAGNLESLAKPMTEAPTTSPVDRTTTAQPQKVQVKHEKCLLPKDSGSCTENQTAWYFDSASGTCVKFVYGGCGVSNYYTLAYIYNEGFFLLIYKLFVFIDF